MTARRIFCLVGLLAASCVEARVLFYPAVLDFGTNLFDGVQWTPPNMSCEKGCTYSRAKGGPFSPDEPAYRVKMPRPSAAYWRAHPPVQAGRTYLVGAWVRFANAKVLLCNDAIHPVTGKRINRRLYCFGGHNAWIEPFLSPRTLEKLVGNADEWRLCYRHISFPDGIKPGSHTSAFGLYIAGGEMEFSHPFFIDVTDLKDKSLKIDIADSKPVRSLAVVHVGLRDVVWRKEFATPVMRFTTTLPGVTDYSRGFDRNTIEGHALEVQYADGSRETVYAPQERIFQEM